MIVVGVDSVSSFANVSGVCTRKEEITSVFCSFRHPEQMISQKNEQCSPRAQKCKLNSDGAPCPSQMKSGISAPARLMLTSSRHRPHRIETLIIVKCDLCALHLDWLNLNSRLRSDNGWEGAKLIPRIRCVAHSVPHATFCTQVHKRFWCQFQHSMQLSNSN